MTKNEVIIRAEALERIREAVTSRTDELRSITEQVSILRNDEQVGTNFHDDLDSALSYLNDGTHSLREALGYLEDATGRAEAAVENEDWDKVATLQAENARLREALQAIADAQPSAASAVVLARNVLNG